MKRKSKTILTSIKIKSPRTVTEKQFREFIEGLGEKLPELFDPQAEIEWEAKVK